MVWVDSPWRSGDACPPRASGAVSAVVPVAPPGWVAIFDEADRPQRREFSVPEEEPLVIARQQSPAVPGPHIWASRRSPCEVIPQRVDRRAALRERVQIKPLSHLQSACFECDFAQADHAGPGRRWGRQRPLRLRVGWRTLAGGHSNDDNRPGSPAGPRLAEPRFSTSTPTPEPARNRIPLRHTRPAPRPGDEDQARRETPRPVGVVR